MDELAEIRRMVDHIERQLTFIDELMTGQSAALREIAHVLSEHGINTSRFTRPTQEVLVAVALNGTY